EVDSPITALIRGERKHTRCVAHTSPSSSWAIWLTDRLQMAGGLVVKQSAADKLATGGEGIYREDVVSTHGTFQRADVLHIYDEKGVELARGMCNFSSDETALIAGRPDVSVKDLLGYKASSRVIDGNNLVILEDHHLNWEQPDESRLVKTLQAAAD
ncbi:MAG: glutamate 5-kinase, partial [Candidatus Azotimanducaceae bacterium]